MDKARFWVMKVCHGLGTELNETYAKAYKKSILKLWKYKKDSKVSKRREILKHLKVLLGRLIRVCESDACKNNIILSELDLEVLEKAKKIHAQ